MTFDHPVWLIAIIVAVPALLYLLREADRRRSAALARFGEPAVLRRSSPLPLRRWRVAGQVLLAIACAALLVAMARPRSGRGEQTLHAASHDVLFVLDLSRSMQARDAEPSRLEAAKQAALAIARRLPDDRVGLVIFGGSAFLQLPLTLDHSALARFVDQAAANQIPSVSTNLEAAADVAASSLVRSGGQGARVAVFLTDGEDVAGKLEGAIGALKHDGIHGYAVGIGTTAGARIPDADSAGVVRYHRDRLGNEVVSHLEEQNLRDIARETGGVYAHWSGEASVTPIVAGISQLATGAAESRARAAIPDRFQWPLALAILALVLESALGLPQRAGRAVRWRERLAFGAGARAGARAGVRVGAMVLLTAGLFAAIGAQGEPGEHEGPVALYHAGRFREAYDGFRARLQALGPRANADERATLSYDMGNALYRMGRFQDAMNAYRLSLGGARAVRARASFNLGNAYMKYAAGQTDRKPGLRAAITAFEDALVADPHDADAKWNLELAVRTLASENDRFGTGLANKAEGGGGNLTKAGYAGQPQTGAGASPGGGFGSSQSGESVKQITESQARRELDAIQKAQVMSQNSNPISGEHSTTPGKDW